MAVANKEVNYPENNNGKKFEKAPSWVRLRLIHPETGEKIWVCADIPFFPKSLASRSMINQSTRVPDQEYMLVATVHVVNDNLDEQEDIAFD